jgi:hypothetical protein
VADREHLVDPLLHPGAVVRARAARVRLDVDHGDRAREAAGLVDVVDEVAGVGARVDAEVGEVVGEPDEALVLRLAPVVREAAVLEAEALGGLEADELRAGGVDRS